CTSVFAYVCSIGLYKRIVNADTQSIRIANADGQQNKKEELSSKLGFSSFLFCAERVGLALPIPTLPRASLHKTKRKNSLK
ncbi:MAG: hypothetical protein IKM47_06280, partial [Bacteroidaceae bacterium]|nr:hypothetical protein [Bacteroidaceae bacterium]